MSDAEAMAAVRALDDCGVVRAALDHPHFVAAYDHGMVDYRPVTGCQDRGDYFLTVEGREVADWMFRGEG